ncbi:unnamed protein product [Parnassius apollo]|uniref:(apollo) hypothetical protein n=1 Tax=Parnassius apollo TaxID=110799 RepID=A0A8S3X4K2_PARAO|nr:unnamed protein product [Parnassius apollo]
MDSMTPDLAMETRYEITNLFRNIQRKERNRSIPSNLSEFLYHRNQEPSASSGSRAYHEDTLTPMTSVASPQNDTGILTKMAEESGERRLRCMLHDVLENSSDEASLTEDSHHCSEHNLESDTELEVNDYQVASDSDSSDENTPLASLRSRCSAAQVHAPHYKSKDGQTW